MISYEVEGWSSAINPRISRFKNLLYDLGIELSEKLSKRLSEISKCDTIRFSTLALDLNGTLTVGGELVFGVIPLLKVFLERGVEIAVLTGNVRGSLEEVHNKFSGAGLKVKMINLKQYPDEENRGTAYKKLSWMLDQEDSGIAYIGNGNGDVLAAGVATLSVGVCQKEGMAGNLQQVVDVTHTSILDALSFLLEESTLRATLHF